MSRAALLERIIAKHQGPGPHRNGSPQSVHAGGGGEGGDKPGGKLDIEALNEALRSAEDDDERIALFKRAMPGVFDVTHGEMHSEITLVKPTGRRSLVVQGVIRHSDNPRDTVGKFTRIFKSTISDPEPTVSHDFLAISPRHQGQGFAQAFNKHNEERYLRAGIKRITLHANIDVGGYAWAKQGYDWSPELWENYAVLQRISNELDGKRQTEMADRIRTGLESQKVENLPTPYEVAMTGWKRNAETWPGKVVMMENDWYGIKYLD